MILYIFYADNALSFNFKCLTNTRAKYCNNKKLLLPGIEPGFTEPQSVVLTTILQQRPCNPLLIFAQVTFRSFSFILFYLILSFTEWVEPSIKITNPICRKSNSLSSGLIVSLLQVLPWLAKLKSFLTCPVSKAQTHMDLTQGIDQALWTAILFLITLKSKSFQKLKWWPKPTFSRRKIRRIRSFPKKWSKKKLK